MKPSLIRFRKAVNKVKLVNLFGGNLENISPQQETSNESEEDVGSIRVCIRVRPFIKEELSGAREKSECCIRMTDKNRVEVCNPQERGPRKYEFDRCYWSHNADHPLYATQETLQEELGEGMIKSALSGFNNCIFAYGQTGSGKSHSVLGGNRNDRGLLPRVVEGLFKRLKDLGKDTTIKAEVSFIEIYNEQIHDLFAVRENGKVDSKHKLHITQHPVLGTIIPGLTEAPVTSCEEVLKLVDYGATMRHVAETAMNAASSRSHCIFTFKLSVSSDGAAKMSQTHLVDLAGSERAARSGASGDRLKEGAAINQSLSTLANVIRELAKQGEVKKRKHAKVDSKKQAANPPFRDSKLTYILKESLTGNSKTIMMAAISPGLADFDETIGTLNFARSVKQVQVGKAVANLIDEKSVEKELRKELDAMRRQLDEIKSQEQQARSVTSNLTGASHEARDVAFGHRRSVTEQRLLEQEQLCKWFGKDWSTLVAEERKNMMKRNAVKHRATKALNAGDLAILQEQFGAKDAAAESDHFSDSASNISERERLQKLPIVYLDGADTVDGVRSTVRIGTASTIAVTGPRAESFKATDVAQRADTLTKELQDMRVTTAKVKALVDQLSATGLPEFDIRPVIVVDPEDEPPKGELLVRAIRGGKHHEYADQLARKVVWLSVAELGERQKWLEQASANGWEAASASFQSHSGDAWDASSGVTIVTPIVEAQLEVDIDAKATRSRDRVKTEWLPDESRPRAETSWLQDQDADDLAGKQDMSQELDDLRKRLASSDEELARLRETTKEVDDIRTKFSSTSEEIARLRNEVKELDDIRTKFSSSSEEIARLRNEVEEVGDLRDELSDMQKAMKDADEEKQKLISEAAMASDEIIIMRKQLSSTKAKLKRSETWIAKDGNEEAGQHDETFAVVPAAMKELLVGGKDRRQMARDQASKLTELFDKLIVKVESAQNTLQEGM